MYTTTITQLTKELLRDNTTIKRKQVKTNGKINELRGGRGPEKKYNLSNFEPNFRKGVIMSKAPKYRIIFFFL